MGFDVKAAHRELEELLPRYLEDLTALVEMDSSTFDKPGNDLVIGTLRRHYERIGATTLETYTDDEFGDRLVAGFAGQGSGNILLVGHTDTVYPTGTVEVRGLHVVGDRLVGPGTADMKAGDLAIVYALQMLLAHGWSDFGRIEVLHNTDEEVGSGHSRELIRERALEADAVFVLEAGRENGNIVSARKGIADFQISVRGRSAHAGVNHDRGRSALLEMAHLVVALEAMNHTLPGVTVNVGKFQAGERPNVVPDSAFAHAEVRAPEREALLAAVERVEQLIRQRTVPGTEASVLTRVAHYPMQRSDVSRRLVETAQRVARQLGFEVNDCATGGASDGNTASAAGRPVLDGLGPIGGATHSPDEWISISSIAPRTALLAGLIAATCESGSV